MKIGIDARLYGPKHTGIGRYVENLIHSLLKLDRDNHYFIFGDPEELSALTEYPNVTVVKLRTRIYSLVEQLINPLVFHHHHLDILHVPHINAPLLYLRPTVITLHDLIKHLSTGKATTTLPAWQYQIKHWGYRLAVFVNLRRAMAIITPSHYWKDYLVRHYHLPAAKIHVTYEAVSPDLVPAKKPDPAIVRRLDLRKPFLVYTGNLYPHKNLEFLISGLKQFNATHQTKLTLAIVAGRSSFAQKIKSDEHIKLVGFLSDGDLAHLYDQALALVQPSLIEGFGLTGLEAMKLGLPVLSSNATCLPEIYAQAALYFDPYDLDDLVEKLDWIVKEKSLRQGLIQMGGQRAKQFSWQQTAKATLDVYQNL